MAFDLPFFSREEFEEELTRVSPEPLPPGAGEALYGHYLELRRWNRAFSLIGPGTAHQVMERHYGESLAALPWIPESSGALLDVGSGAGFPGLVLAAALPGWRVTLVESRERKWAFLMAVARRTALPCHVLNARVGLPLPAGLPEAIDVVTMRAVKLTPPVLEALAGRLGPKGRILVWTGEKGPRLPATLAPRRSVGLPGSRSLRLVEIRPR